MKRMDKKQLEQVQTFLIRCGKERNEALRAMTIDKIQYFTDCINQIATNFRLLSLLLSTCLVCVSFAILKDYYWCALVLSIFLTVISTNLNKHIYMRAALFMSGRCNISDADDCITVQFADSGMFNKLKLRKED